MTDNEIYRLYLEQLMHDSFDCNVVVWSDGQHIKGLDLNPIQSYDKACKVRDVYKDFNHQGLKYIRMGITVTVYPYLLATVVKLGMAIAEILRGDFAVCSDENGEFIYERGNHTVLDLLERCAKDTANQVGRILWS